MKFKWLYIYYLVCILTKGLAYSYATTKIILLSEINIFLILLLSLVVEFIVFIEVSYLKIISNASIKSISFGGSFLLLLLIIVEFNNDVVHLIVHFTFITFLFSNLLLKLESNILNTSNNYKMGLTNITVLNNLSKLLGFSMGAIFYNLSIEAFALFIIFILLFSSLFKIPNKNLKEKENEVFELDYIKKNKLADKQYLLILALLGSITVYWIPVFVDVLEKENLLRYSFIIFLLPGIFSISFLSIIKKKPQFLLKKYDLYFYFVFLLVFFVSFYFNFIFLSFFLINLIFILSISISIDIRAVFLKLNSHADKKYLLQLFKVTPSFMIFAFTLLSFSTKHTPEITLGLNALAVLIYSVKKEKAHEHEY
ncbi:hypothetical protein H1Z61_03195 [Bacillus aquiflavi]|uniref:MFS transporter n=1 Tax=Bacillus aquiflavi TaxID=2672567 RepID=A0A6B3VXT3_9BACI|nr:hypothetical protein [Bacillus aquiflavi]MBA4536170.1 hypothetical protein [Bacillus aquiflavi]NEY80543.1 hypothetical protein [Bacillus aquiflavi]